jgi:hypothetical protein
LRASKGDQARCNWPPLARSRRLATFGRCRKLYTGQRREGYLVVPNVVNPEQIARLRAFFRPKFDSPPFLGDTDYWLLDLSGGIQKSVGSASMCLAKSPRKRVPEFRGQTGGGAGEVMDNYSITDWSWIADAIGGFAFLTGTGVCTSG